MRHLISNIDGEGYSDEYWCGADAHSTENAQHETADPRDSTCAECLRNAAEYGAAAAMRCAAVEAGAERDPELEKERDHAIAELNKLQEILGQNGLFACAGCSRLWHVDAAGFCVGASAWCHECSGARGRIL